MSFDMKNRAKDVVPKAKELDCLVSARAWPRVDSPVSQVHPRVIAGNAKHYVHHFDAIHEARDAA